MRLLEAGLNIKNFQDTTKFGSDIIMNYMNIQSKTTPKINYEKMQFEAEEEADWNQFRISNLKISLIICLCLVMFASFLLILEKISYSKSKKELENQINNE